MVRGDGDGDGGGGGDGDGGGNSDCDQKEIEEEEEEEKKKNKKNKEEEEIVPFTICGSLAFRLRASSLASSVFPHPGGPDRSTLHRV
jgi:hypothetical protein